MFQLVFAAVLSTQIELHTLTALGVQWPEQQHGCLLTIQHVVLGFQTAVLRLACFVAGITRIGSQSFVARNLGHSAAINIAQGDLNEVSGAEKLPRRLHGVPSPVGAATGTEAARPQDNARRRAGTRGSNEKQC